MVAANVNTKAVVNTLVQRGFTIVRLEEVEGLYAFYVQSEFDAENGSFWVVNNSSILGLGRISSGQLLSEVNFQPAAAMKIDLTIRNSLKK